MRHHGVASKTFSIATVKNKNPDDHSRVFVSGAIIVDLQCCERSGVRQDRKQHPAKRLSCYHWLILHDWNNVPVVNNTDNQYYSEYDHECPYMLLRSHSSLKHDRTDTTNVAVK